MQAPTLSPPSSAQAVWDAHYATPAGFRHWPCEELVRAVGQRHFGTVLEAGCGNGANLWMLAEHAEQVIGVDANQAARAAADIYMLARGARDAVSLRAGDIAALPVEDGSLDALVDVMTSQHAEYAAHHAIYREYRRALRVGGWFFLYHLGEGTTVRDADAIGVCTYRELPALFPGVGPVCLPHPLTLESVVSAAGFRTSPPRTVRRTYANGTVAEYVVMEAVAV